MTGTALTIPAGPVQLEALLALPPGCRALVVFVHGSGSSRLSPRNRRVASLLQQAGLATLLFDLLTPEEERSGMVSSVSPQVIERCSERLLASLGWLTSQVELAPLFPVGLFGASSGAAVALQVAAARPAWIAAVVSRGGRPDLAPTALAQVSAPTLLIVGGRDQAVLSLNQQAASQLRGPHQLVVVPGASHLFEEPGCLAQVAELASDWFRRYLVSPATLRPGGRPDTAAGQRP